MKVPTELLPCPHDHEQRVGEASRQIIHELAADIRDRLSHEEGSANWRNAQRIVELSRPSAALVPARVEAVDRNAIIEECATEVDRLLEALHRQHEVLDIGREDSAYTIAARAIRSQP